MSDENDELNLMYDHERNEIFRQIELAKQEKEKPRKKGPREMLCPEKLTINRMELEHGYDKEDNNPTPVL